jgi:hypothetical protein
MVEALNMTKEEKQLLLKDLCARLPYRVKIQTWYGEIITSDLNIFPFSTKEMDEEDMWDQLNGFKPYLRPMSSMTEEERKYYNQLSLSVADSESDAYEETDWLNAHHFDYRIVPSTGKTMIESNLALEAPEGMYKTE